jgi:predicted TIM-barrel fold metal-dependent hydrolase
MNRFSFSWCRDIPRLNRSFLIEDYLDAIRGLGIEKSVHVEADVDEPYMLAETRYILGLAESSENPLTGVVACCRPEHNGFRQYLDQIAGYPALKGVRRILHTQPDSIGQSRTFIENIRALSSYGLSFDVNVLARQLPIAINLVKSCPDVTFMREISRFPNVSCKVSGILVYADHENWTAEDLGPFIDHTLECFGWERVMFGSDWPVVTQAATLKKWVETLSFLTEGASEGDRRKLFYENAARVYRLT